MYSRRKRFFPSLRSPKKLEQEKLEQEIFEQSGYEVVIVGGGLAGLYSAYRILQANPDTRLLIVEKRADLGGRVFTYRDDTMTVEAGAGRFSREHTRLWKLLRELGLASKAVPIPGGFTYVDSSTGNEAPGPEKDVAEVVKAGKSETLSYLRSVSFLDFAKRVIGASRAQHIVDSFGYYSELVVMNAHDAMVLMDVLDNPAFFSLQGGLSLIITELEQRIRAFPNATIWTDTLVKRFEIFRTSKCGDSRESRRKIALPTLNRGSIRRGRKIGRRGRRGCRYSLAMADGRRVSAERCIFAVPKQALESLSAFRPVRPLLNQIACGSLCRIYSQFPSFPSEEILYAKKRTINNDLRMMIPIDSKSGVVMISYTDNRFADAWHAMEQQSVESVDTQIARLVNETLSIRLPKPLKTKVFYWPCGVGYWKVGANSLAVSRRIVRPFPGHAIYVCGEHYSEKYQQWMEGALETSDTVIRNFRS